MSSFLGLMFLFFGISSLLEGGSIGGTLVLFGIAYAIFNNAKRKEYKKDNSKGLNISKSKLTKFNKAMRSYFAEHDELKLSDNIILRANNLSKNRNVELDVYYDNEYICRFSEFSEYFSGTHAKMIDQILEETTGYAVGSIVEPEVEKKAVVKEHVNEKSSSEAKVDKNSAAYYIKVIDDLNIDIRKEEITNDLYQTTAMLKQISMIETKYPENKEKLVKLYQYYLPILVNILSSYVKLISSNSKHEDIDKIETKLRKTIILVNEALKTITMQLCEEDILDLNSDMSVLETILRKDGLVKDGTIYGNESSVSSNGK
ncbi:MAG: 5-bromo-4-chloroindolyl phosphate hydrolysis family protein [Erysipelotrichales bacterium]|nr:5-bromo-4-chloroindolyl phosphate hydrolysis family protein [Erysipelotrichales bacterium]